MEKQQIKQGFWTYYLAGLLVRMSGNNLFLFAGGLAFATLITLVPLIFLVFLVLGVVLEEASMARLIDVVLEVFIPYEEEAEYLREVLFSRIPGVVEFKEAFGVSGLLILIFSASGLFSSMRTVLNTVFQASGKERNLPERLFGHWTAEAGKPKETGKGTSGRRYTRCSSPFRPRRKRGRRWVRVLPGAGPASCSWPFRPRWAS